jgi:hypothetical protein
MITPDRRLTTQEILHRHFRFKRGLDLHARQRYAFLMDQNGQKLAHTNIRNDDFNCIRKLVASYRYDLTARPPPIASADVPCQVRLAVLRLTNGTGDIESTIRSTEKLSVIVTAINSKRPTRLAVTRL